MKINADRLFPYPVLAEGRDDYKTCKFDAKIKSSYDAADNLILQSRENFLCKVPLNRVKKNLACVALIVLLRDVENFSCKDWNDDFTWLTFNLAKGSVLAYQNFQPLTLPEDKDIFKNVSSIFSVYKKLGSVAPFDVEITSEKIKIGLNEKDYTLSKYWWAGHIFSSEGLDVLGAKDFYTKIFSIMTRSFIGNAKLLSGFMKFLSHFKDRGIILSADNHIRPAMSELNKRGGAIILDCLTEEEIAAIMIEHVEKILAPKVVAFKPPEKPAVAPSKNSKAVKANNIVRVLLIKKGTQHSYRINDKLQKYFPDIYDELFGKEINSLVTIRGKTCRITEIK